MNLSPELRAKIDADKKQPSQYQVAATGELILQNYENSLKGPAVVKKVLPPVVSGTQEIVTPSKLTSLTDGLIIEKRH